MKHFLLVSISVLALLGRIAAQTPVDSLMQQLQLTPEQKIILKTLIRQHKEEEKKQEAELRRKMLQHLTVQQQVIVKHWWKKKQHRDKRSARVYLKK